TIQGEGPFCGQPAVFVRLAGCNLQCPGCDTNYTSNRKKMSHSDIWQEIVHVTGEAKTKLVVITGGEPFRQPEVVNFINYLIDMKGYRVQVETNGTMPI
ncbi:7-carboxy-7-deazaguanine synthase QueE, partial [Dyella japonica]|uniref:7-carboxy-7-deazaguanine synthase QueE n=1 Tax=Dyella japonica TaxID=231455 RepID=UPI00062DA23A